MEECPGSRRRGQFQRQEAFLGDADERRRAVEPFENAFRDQQPLIQHEVETHAAALQQLRDRRRAVAPAQLLIVAEGQIQRLSRPEALRDHELDRLHDGHEVALVVPGASAPDEAVSNLAGERGDGPIAVRSRGDRHHVLMCHEHRRLGPRIVTRPCVEQAQAADDFALEHRMRLRKTALQQRVQLAELFRGRRQGRRE
jgi:hypothetical protein